MSQTPSTARARGPAESEAATGGAATLVEEGRAEALDHEGVLDLESELNTRAPFAYRRLFRTTPLEVSQFLAGRSTALGIVEQAARRWRQGRFSSVVVIGEQGSGKTSLINCAMEQKLKGMPLVRHRIEETLTRERQLLDLLNVLLDTRADDLAELAARVSSAHERRVVLLEDVHRLHLRAVGGLELLLRFLEFADATGTRILWLVSVEQSAWQYLDHVEQISRHFAFRIETGHLSRPELEGAIMARHRATGYQLRFVDPASGQADQASLQRDFFDSLSRACGGNVFSAIFYWLRSVERVDGDVLEIRPLEELKLDFLQQLPTEDLLDAAMVIEHGGITAEHFAAVFRIPSLEARSRLTHLERMGIVGRVNREEGGDRYAVNQLIYHPVVTHMRRRSLVR